MMKSVTPSRKVSINSPTANNMSRQGTTTSNLEEKLVNAQNATNRLVAGYTVPHENSKFTFLD